MQILRTILLILGLIFLSRILRRLFASNKGSNNRGASNNSTKSEKPKKIKFDFKDVEDADFEEIKKDKKD